jgi:hypothetical protein
MDDDDDFNGCVDLDKWFDIIKGSQKSQTASVGSNHSHSINGCPGVGYVNTAPRVPVMFDDIDSDAVCIKGKMVISDVNGNNKIDVSEFMQTMKERLCILQPNFEAMKEYPALKDAYDQYLMLEKLLTDHNNAKKD